MYCKACGTLIDDDSVFCSKCGLKLSESIPTSATKHENVRALQAGQPDNIITPVNQQTSFDRTSIRVLGFAIIIIGGIFMTVADINPNETTIFLVGTLIIVMRVAGAQFAYKAAKELNRDPGLWAVIGFFIPAIMLIIISYTKRLPATRV